MRTSVHVHGPATLDEAWDRYDRFDAWPTWAPQIRGVRADGGRLRPGVRGTVHGPAGVRVPFRIDDVDPTARRWSWTVWAFARPIRLHHDLRATERGTRAGLTVEGPAVLVLPYAQLTRWPLRRLLR